MSALSQSHSQVRFALRGAVYTFGRIGAGIEAATVTAGFEWDERKNVVDLEKHGLDFRDAVEVFDHPHLTSESSRGGELRRVSLGLVGRAVVAVVWTDRSGTIRIISARAARRNERHIYETRFGAPA